MASSWTAVKAPVPVHFGDDFVIARVGRIDDHDVFRVDGAQADLVGRIAFRRLGYQRSPLWCRTPFSSRYCRNSSRFSPPNFSPFSNGSSNAALLM